MPKVCLVSTGGTIAGLSKPAGSPDQYIAGQLDGATLLAGVEQQASQFDWTFEQPYSIGSQNLQWNHMLLLRERLIHLLSDTELDALIVTHGTDCMEDMLFFLYLTLPLSLQKKKPIVFVGSMRAADHPQTDATANLESAIEFVSGLIRNSKTAFGLVMNGRFTAAEHVKKRHTTALSAFDCSQSRPINSLKSKAVENLSSFCPPPACLSEKLKGDQLVLAQALEEVPLHLVFCAPGFSPEFFEIKADSRKSSLWVIASPGHGSVPEYWIEFLRDKLKAGDTVFRASRVLDGGVNAQGEFSGLEEYQVGFSELQFEPISRHAAHGVLVDTRDMSLAQTLVFARLLGL